MSEDIGRQENIHNITIKRNESLTVASSFSSGT
jgi:hypothetical protein